MAEYLFNVDNGYLEGLVRGFRSGILSRTDYINLVQCETIEGEVCYCYINLVYNNLDRVRPINLTERP